MVDICEIFMHWHAGRSKNRGHLRSVHGFGFGAEHWSAEARRLVAVVDVALRGSASDPGWFRTSGDAGGGYCYRPVQLYRPEPPLNVFEPDSKERAASFQGDAKGAQRTFGLRQRPASPGQRLRSRLAICRARLSLFRWWQIAAGNHGAGGSSMMALRRALLS